MKERLFDHDSQPYFCHEHCGKLYQQFPLNSKPAYKMISLEQKTSFPRSKYASN